MLDKLIDATTRATRLLALCGAGLLVAAMALTVIDVALRKPFGIALPGTVDLTQLLIIGAAWFSIPHGFMVGGHVTVSALSDRLPKPLHAAVRAAGAALGAALMAGIAWTGATQAALEQSYGEISLTLGLPKLLYWLPLIAGATLAALVLLTLAALAVTGRQAPSDPESNADV